MIEKGGTKNNVVFALTCDYCKEEYEELFETFDNAVDYKTDRENGWVSVRGKNGDWYELCPLCNKPEIIAELKGIAWDSTVQKSRQNLPIAELAELALEDFGGC